MSSHLKAELAATCSTLGRLHKGVYLIEPECLESIKDLIRYLKRDNESHEIRRYLGECKVLQNDLIHIIKNYPPEMPDLFDVTLRLLINLTTPTMLFYGEEIPTEKVGRNVYLSLIGFNQDYKMAFCDIEFWSKMCGKLTNLFETEGAERSLDDGIQIERILMLLRNVLQVPADFESERRPENDVTVHDKVLWALRQSQILELLLFVSSNQNEEHYYLNLVEIFSLILREQNPKSLAKSDAGRSASEKSKDTEDLMKAREAEKKGQNKYLNMRNFSATFVMKGVKSFADKDVVCHKSLDKVNRLDVGSVHGKQVRAKRNRIPVESERVERRSTFSVRLFLKEFSLEFLNSGFNHLMKVVKNRLDSGKSLARDESYYFWAIKFFLDLAIASDSDVSLIKDCLSAESFHFVQTSMDSAFEHLLAEKKKAVDWVKRIHLILKAYRSLLETLLWMDGSKNPLVRATSREIKSQIFYVVEYREMTLHVLLRYDHTRFSLSYLRDLIETIHLFIKLLEEFSKEKKLVVQKVTRARSRKKNKRTGDEPEDTKEEKWERLKDEVYDTLSCEISFPEIPPFDAALDIAIDDQKARAMKKIQKLLLDGNIRDGIGFLRSARQVWPENDYFGSEGMAPEEETMALQEICLADLGEVEGDDKEKDKLRSEEKEEEEEGEEEDDDEDKEDMVRIVEQEFDVMDYKKRFVNKKVVESCGMLLKNYKKNSELTNHCAIKLLHRIGWECCMPAMLYQASLFWTLLKIMKDKSKAYFEINKFTVNLLRKFKKHACKNGTVFLELLFWKEHNIALEIQHGYEPYECKGKSSRRHSKNKSGRREEKEKEPKGLEIVEGVESSGKNTKGEKTGEKTVRKSRKKGRSLLTNDINWEQLLNSIGAREENDVDGDVGAVSGKKPKATGNESEASESEDEFLAKRSFQRNEAFGDSAEDEPKERSQTSNNGIKLFDSSDEGKTEAGKENRISRRLLESPGRSQAEQNGWNKEESNLSLDEQSDNVRNGGSQTSDTSKKRLREREEEEESPSDSSAGKRSEERGNSKSKRPRYIGSDSDSEGDMPSVAKQHRKRLAIIDSDSDG